MEKLGRVICNRHEDMWISLTETLGKSHLELHVYSRSADGSPESSRMRDLVILPIEQLPALLQHLLQARDLCTRRGLLGNTPPPEMVLMERGEAVGRGRPTPMAGSRCRRHLRVPIQCSVVCRPLGANQDETSPLLRGEIRDLSLEGAQAWLPSRVGLFQRVDVAALIDGEPFRARAEIVAADLPTRNQPGTGYLRHSFRWVEIGPQAKDLLSRTVSKALTPGNASAESPHQVSAVH